jgi:hypothetical protein
LTTMSALRNRLTIEMVGACSIKSASAIVPLMRIRPRVMLHDRG